MCAFMPPLTFMWLIVLQNWEVSYKQDTPVAPRFDVNAPDLYIPAMGFITYVLVAGVALGTQNRYASRF